MWFLVILEDHHCQDAQKNTKVPVRKGVKDCPAALSYEKHRIGQNWTPIKDQQTTKYTITVKCSAHHGQQLTRHCQQINAQHLQNSPVRYVSSYAVPDNIVRKKVKNGRRHLKRNECFDQGSVHFIGKCWKGANLNRQQPEYDERNDKGHDQKRKGQYWDPSWRKRAGD